MLAWKGFLYNIVKLFLVFTDILLEGTKTGSSLTYLVESFSLGKSL